MANYNIDYGMKVLEPRSYGRLSAASTYADVDTSNGFGGISQRIPVRQTMDLDGHPVLGLKQINMPSKGFEAFRIEAKIDIGAKPMKIPYLGHLLGAEFEADMRAVINRNDPLEPKYPASGSDPNIMVAWLDIQEKSRLDFAMSEILAKVDYHRSALIDELFVDFCGATPEQFYYENRDLGMPVNKRLVEGIRRMREDRLIRNMDYDTWGLSMTKYDYEISRELREKAEAAERERRRIAEEKERNRIIEEEAAAIVAREALEANPLFGGF